MECKTERVKNRNAMPLASKPLSSTLESPDVALDEINFPDLERLTLAATKAFDSKPGEAYFTYFHHRWPIIHAPTYDETRASPLLAKSVRMIDDWLGNDSTSRRKRWH